MRPVHDPNLNSWVDQAPGLASRTVSSGACDFPSFKIRFIPYTIFLEDRRIFWKAPTVCQFDIRKYEQKYVDHTNQEYRIGVEEILLKIVKARRAYDGEDSNAYGKVVRSTISSD
jgi:hypothetical protein